MTLREERRQGKLAAQGVILLQLEREVDDRLRVVRIMHDPTCTLLRDSNDAYRRELLRLARVALRAVREALR